MNTLAWLLLLIGAVILRQVSKGRVMNLGEDLADSFLAITTGDTKKLNEVLSREGESDEPAFASLGDAMGEAVVGVAGASGTTASEIAKAIGGQLEGIEAKANNSLALSAYLLGSKAKGYRWAATGPDYYDCSGLMWRAAQKIGFTGARFTTSTIMLSKQFRRVVGPVDRPSIDDIVLWPTHHMGVVTGPDQFYSARSRNSGIGFNKISTWRNGATPQYYRYVGK